MGDLGIWLMGDLVIRCACAGYSTLRGSVQKSVSTAGYPPTPKGQCR